MSVAWLFALLMGGCFSAHSQDADLVRQLDKEIIALRQRMAWLEASGASMGSAGEPAPIYAELVQVFSGSEIEVTRKGSTTMVSFSVALLFPRTGMRIRSEAAMYLDLLATALNLHPEFQVMVVGYSDDSPVGGSARTYYATNWELSAVRAGAVARELMDAYQIDPQRVTLASRGALDPIAENDTPEGRAQNRRVVVHILPPSVIPENAP